jgi:hypothetical protein
MIKRKGVREQKNLGKTDLGFKVSSILGYDAISLDNWFSLFSDKIMVSYSSARPLTLRPLCLYKTS